MEPSLWSRVSRVGVRGEWSLILEQLGAGRDFDSLCDRPDRPLPHSRCERFLTVREDEAFEGSAGLLAEATLLCPQQRR